VVARQDLPTKSNIFAYAYWPDLIRKNFDVNALFRYDPVDHGRFYWIELVSKHENFNLELSWQGSSGRDNSVFAYARNPRIWMLSCKYFL
jgi:hypothetical protein